LIQKSRPGGKIAQIEAGKPGRWGVEKLDVRSEILSSSEGNAMLSEMIDKGCFSPFERLDELI